MTQPPPQGRPQYAPQPQCAPQPQSPAQPYGSQPYPAQQQYPAQQYEAQQYPAQQYQGQQHQAQQYPAQPYQGQHYQGQQAQAAPMVQCRFCGCGPAAKVRGHQGMILLMRFQSLDGPFCRDCGLSTFRSMTAKTLVQGWWGYASFVITPITVLINLVRRDRVASLAPPQASPTGGSRQPMDPGPPLMARSMAIIGLSIPVVLFLLIVVVAVAGG
jgi:hypothetical protein